MQNNNFIFTPSTFKNHTIAVQEVNGYEKHLEVYLQLPELNAMEVDDIFEKFEKLLPGEPHWCEAYFPWESPVKKENRNLVVGWCLWSNGAPLLKEKALAGAQLALEKILSQL